MTGHLRHCLLVLGFGTSYQLHYIYALLKHLLKVHQLWLMLRSLVRKALRFWVVRLFGCLSIQLSVKAFLWLSMSLFNGGILNGTCDKYSLCEREDLWSFSRSEVKHQGRCDYICANYASVISVQSLGEFWWNLPQYSSCQCNDLKSCSRSLVVLQGRQNVWQRDTFRRCGTLSQVHVFSWQSDMWQC